jgi:tetratricopeptide (TPR) repeat protein
VLAARVDVAPAAELPAAIGIAAALGPAGVAFGAAEPGFEINPALVADVDRAVAGLELGFESGAETPRRVGLRVPAAERAGLGLDFASGASGPAGIDRRSSEWRLSGGRRLATAVAVGAALRLRRESVNGTDDTSHGVDAGVHVRRAGIEIGAVVRNAVRPLLQFEPNAKPEPRLLQAAVAISRPLRSAWSAGAAAGVLTSTSTRGALWLGTHVRSPYGVEIGLGGSARIQSLGLGARLGPAQVAIVASRGDDDAVATAVRVPFGGSRQARRDAAVRRADDAFSARVGREIEAQQTTRVDAWRAEAAAAAARGEPARAVDLYRNVLLWNADDAAARDGLRRAQRDVLLAQADSLVAKRDYWGAGGALETVLGQFPEDSVATQRLGVVRKAMRRVDRSRGEAKEQVQLGIDAYAAKRYTAAVGYFEAARRLDPHNTTAGDFLDRARAALEQQLAGGVAQARERLERGDPDAARTALEAVLGVAPKRPDALALRAEIERESARLATDRRRPVRSDAEPAREDRAPVPPAVLSSGYKQGLQLYRAGDLVAAMRAWEDVARLAPHYEDVDQYLLRVYRVCGLERYTEGRLQDAIDIWEKALRLEPDNAQVRRYLNQANAKMKRAHGPRGTR